MRIKRRTKKFFKRVLIAVPILLVCAAIYMVVQASYVERACLQGDRAYASRSNRTRTISVHDAAGLRRMPFRTRLLAPGRISPVIAGAAGERRPRCRSKGCRERSLLRTSRRPIRKPGSVTGRTAKKIRAIREGNFQGRAHVVSTDALSRLQISERYRRAVSSGVHSEHAAADSKFTFNAAAFHFLSR